VVDEQRGHQLEGLRAPRRRFGRGEDRREDVVLLVVQVHVQRAVESREDVAGDRFARGDYEKAIRQYEEAMRARPEDYQSPLLVAGSFVALGRPKDADAVRRRGIKLAEEHLRLNPDDARALYMGANGLVALGELERGLEWADRALAIDPDDSMLLYNIACIKSLALAKEEALDCLERSVRAGLTLRGWLLHDTDLDPIRDDPRFDALIKSLG